jgi:hypothetical protein
VEVDQQEPRQGGEQEEAWHPPPLAAGPLHAASATPCRGGLQRPYYCVLVQACGCGGARSGNACAGVGRCMTVCIMCRVAEQMRGYGIAREEGEKTARVMSHESSGPDSKGN